MTKAVVAGTFATGANPVAGNTSESIDIPSSKTIMLLTTLGLDSNNTIKTQKITSPGTAWVDQTTYNSDQTNTAITVVQQEQWRVVGVTQQAVKDILYKLSVES